MKDSDLIARKEEDFLTTMVDGELVGMSVEQGACYGLNRVGTRLWELIETPRSFGSLCAQLQAEFEVEEAQCRAELAGFVEEMRREGLVTVRPGP